MEWSLTTDLDDWTAVTLLGRPVEEVEGVEINGHEWETASDDSGPFLMPTSYQFDDRILTVLMKFDLDDDYDQAYCFNRVGPLCQLWNYAWWEAGETQHIIHEPDDLAAVERFAADLREAGKLGGCAGHGRPGWPARRRRARPAHSCARRLGPRLAPRMVAR
jgi:hypothetical protein